MKRFREIRLSEQISRCGNYEDTSLSAATRSERLDERKRHRRRLEAIRRLKRLEMRVKIMMKGIQRNWRKFSKYLVAHEVSKVLNGARTIQLAWRDYHWKKRALAFEICAEAALILQCFWRQCLSKELLWRKCEIRIESMCTKLQSFFRGCLVRIRLKKFNLIRHFCATQIQRCLRGYKGRMLYLSKVVETATLVIQRFYRKYVFRVKILRFKEYIFQQNSRRKECVKLSLEDLLSAEATKSWETERKIKEMKIKEEEAKKRLARKHGIILLPWRRKTTNLSLLVQEQIRRQKEKKNKCVESSISDSSEVENKQIEEYRKLVLSRVRREVRKKQRKKDESFLDLRHYEEHESVPSRLKTDENDSCRESGGTDRKSNFSAPARDGREVLRWSKHKIRRKLSKEFERAEARQQQIEQRKCKLQNLALQRERSLRKFQMQKKVWQSNVLISKEQEKKLQMIKLEERKMKMVEEEKARRQKLEKAVEREKRRRENENRRLEMELDEEEKKRKIELKQKMIRVRAMIRKNLQGDSTVKSKRTLKFPQLKAYKRKQRITKKEGENKPVVEERVYESSFSSDRED